MEGADLTKHFIIIPGACHLKRPNSIAVPVFEDILVEFETSRLVYIQFPTLNATNVTRQNES